MLTCYSCNGLRTCDFLSTISIQLSLWSRSDRDFLRTLQACRSCWTSVRTHSNILSYLVGRITLKTWHLVFQHTQVWGTLGYTSATSSTNCRAILLEIASKFDFYRDRCQAIWQKVHSIRRVQPHLARRFLHYPGESSSAPPVEKSPHRLPFRSLGDIVLPSHGSYQRPSLAVPNYRKC